MWNRPQFFLAILMFLLAAPASHASTPEIFLGVGHSEAIQSIAISKDDALALSGGNDKTVKLWNVATGQLIRTLWGHTGSVRSVAISPDNKMAVSGGRDKQVILWDLLTGRVLQKWSHKSPVVQCAFVQNGYAVSTLTTRGFYRKFEVQTGRKLSKVQFSAPQANRKDAYIRRVSPSGRTCLTVTLDGGWMAWDTESARVISRGRLYKTDIFTNNYPSEVVQALNISADGQYAVFTLNYAYTRKQSKSITLEVWDLKNSRLIKKIEPKTFTMFAGTFLPDSHQYLLSSESPQKDGHTRFLYQLFDVSRMKVLQKWEKRDFGSLLENGVFTSQGNQLLACATSSRIGLWDLEQATFIKRYGHRPQRSRWLAVNHDRSLAADLQNNAFWNLKTGEFVKHLREVSHGSKTISPDGSRLVSISDNSLIEIWDVPKAVKLKQYQKKKIAGNNSVWKTVFTPDGRHFITGGYECPLILWELATGKEIWRINKTSLRGIAFQPDGKRFLLYQDVAKHPVFGDEKTWLVDTMTGRPILPLRQKWMYHAEFMPDGNTAIALDASNWKFLIWDLNTGQIKKAYAAKNMNPARPGNGEAARAFAYSPDRKIAACNNGGPILLWDIENSKLKHILQGHTSSVHSLFFTRDGKRLISGGSGGSIRVWDVDSGQELGRMFSFNSGDWDKPPEWVSIIPEGYFNASATGSKKVFIRKGFEVYYIDQLFEQFFNPGIVALKINGDPIAIKRDLAKGFNSPPRVRIVSPPNRSSVKTDTVQIKVEVEDTGGGIGEIKLFHNGKALNEGKRAVQAIAKNEQVFHVGLLSGENVLRVVGFSPDRIEGNPSEIVVTRESESTEANLSVLAIGINKYRNPALNLNFAVPDAEGVADFFEKQGTALFNSVQVHRLYDESATGQAIHQLLQSLKSTRPQDVVVIYMAGHGESVGENWYFLPHELTYPEKEAEVEKKGISSQAIATYLRNTGARKILLAMDACKAGAALVSFRGFSDRRALMQLARASGVHVIAASGQDQFAAEIKELGHGVFTHALLAGLGGKGAAQDNNTVTVRSVLTYVESNLPELSEKYRKVPQFPVADSRGMDFPLSLRN